MGISYFFCSEITALPEYLFTEGGSIAILIVRDNKVKSIDSKICKLSNLRILDVSGNCLTDLPESMVALPHLSALDISRNPMQSIPKSVCKCVRGFRTRLLI